MKKFSKFFISFVCSIPLILMILLSGLTVYDWVHVSQLKSMVKQVKIGDTEEEVIKKLGDPNYTWSKGSSCFWGKNTNSGRGEGHIPAIDFLSSSIIVMISSSLFSIFCFILSLLLVRPL